MQLRQHLDIPNTLALRSTADYGCEAYSSADVADAQAYAQAHQLAFVPLGEGSNVVLHARVRSFVCLLRSAGIEVLQETAEHVTIRVAAGENWHQFVLHCLRQGWYGLENLTLIPGSVGAAPVQNIGAYGVEIAQFIEAVEVLHPQGEVVALNAAQCRFGYRDSVFKHQPGYTILNVTLRLNKQDAPVFDYPELQAALAEQTEVAAQHVADAVIRIRQRKLPAPEEHPNVGSFFKNPVVSQAQADELNVRIDDLQTYPMEAGSGRVKLSAAQLIDRAGWKEKPGNHVSCWSSQPLVLVNTGGASDVEVFTFAAAIADDIYRRYGVQLELEPSELS